jgi:DNA mismatch repair protein MutL
VADDDATDSDGIIQVMPDRLANKIAAGEVVQRPASVEKELIENALDAGASSIEVLAKDAGRTLVQVIDDGCGMSAADAERCFQRHATSKVRAIEDLERIRTLGFRGEALASIAAVSQVEMKTKRVEDDAGTLVRVDGGDLEEQRPCATPSGTSVAVRNLFYNVPARRNFLKTDATELKHLSETFQFLALSNPGVAFRFEHNGHEHYDLSAARTDDFFEATRQRIEGLFGADTADALVPVDDRSSDLGVEGFVGAPDAHRRTRGEQFLFVNERYVDDRYLRHAVKKAYGDLLPDGAFPFFTLFLSMDPRRVDVNVHPTKAEVKFDDQSGIYGFLRSAVRSALGRANLTPRFQADEDGEEPTSFQPRDASAGSDGADDGGAASDGSGGDGAAGNGAWEGGAETSSHGPVSPGSPAGRSPSARSPSGRSSSDGSGADRSASGRSSSGGSSAGGSSAGGRTGRGARRTSGAWVPPGEQSEALYGGNAGTDEEADASPNREGDEARGEGHVDGRSERRPLWALHDTYLLAPTDEGLMVVDQRAAHLRVLYENALEHLREQQGESQQLLFPHTVELPPADADLLEELLPDLRALGFDLERLSGRTVAVRGVPADVREGKEQTILEEVLEQVKTRQDRVEDERRKHLARTLARRSAVERGQPLSDAERRGLLNDLFRCEMPYADPAGNPTLVRMSMEEIEKRFRQ